MLSNERLLKLKSACSRTIQNAGAELFMRGAHHRRCAREGLTGAMMPYGYALLQARERFVRTMAATRVWCPHGLLLAILTQHYAGVS